MFSGVIFLVIFAAAIAGALIRDIRREARMAADAVAPACCGMCKHETTLDVLSRGRCPECGALYLYAGVEAPHQRLNSLVASKSLYAWVILAGLALSIVAAFGVSELAEAVLGRTQGRDWASVVGFLVGLVLLCGLPCWLLSRRRRRLIRRIKGQMMPVDGPLNT